MGSSLLTITCGAWLCTSEVAEMTIMWPVKPMLRRMTVVDSAGTSERQLHGSLVKQLPVPVAGLHAERRSDLLDGARGQAAREHRAAAEQLVIGRQIAGE